jgi:uncharacterized protein YggE|tara:strand:+ start:21 stop:857 length:837 start_codon:yes stop_codon:yes gene_type:complete
MSKVVDKKKLSLIGMLLLFLILVTGCNDDIKSESSNTRAFELESNNPETRLVNSNESTLDQNIFWIKGSGIVKQPQEKIEINIAIEHRDKDITNASNIVNTNIEKIINIAKNLGISEDDIETQEFSISPVERWIQKEDEYGEYGESEIIAYRVYNSILITSEDMSIVTKFIDLSTIEAGNSIRINKIAFKAKEIKDNKILSREKAVNDALEKANFYKEKLNIKLGDIIYFEEFSPYSSQSDNNMPMMMSRMEEAMPSTSLYAGESEILSEIYLGFEIK